MDSKNYNIDQKNIKKPATGGDMRPQSKRTVRGGGLAVVFGGERDSESRAFLRFGLHVDLPAVLLDDLARDDQAQARAAVTLG